MNPSLEHITPETAQRLIAQAEAQGLSVDAYLQTLLGFTAPEPGLAALSPTEYAASACAIVKMRLGLSCGSMRYSL